MGVDGNVVNIDWRTAKVSRRGSCVKIYDGDVVYKLNNMCAGAVVEPLVSSFLWYCSNIPADWVTDYSFVKIAMPENVWKRIGFDESPVGRVLGSSGGLWSASKAYNFGVKLSCLMNEQGGAEAVKLKYSGNKFFRLGREEPCKAEIIAKNVVYPGITGDRLTEFSNIQRVLNIMFECTDHLPNHPVLLRHKSLGGKYVLCPWHNFEGYFGSNQYAFAYKSGSRYDPPKLQQSVDVGGLPKLKVYEEGVMRLLKYAKESPEEALGGCADDFDKFCLRTAAIWMESCLKQFKGVLWEPSNGAILG